MPEFWQLGPVDGVPALLQPVAHALLQARQEVREMMDDFPETLLWERPAGTASPGFHLQHLSGVLDRLFTYARAEALTNEQFSALRNEGSDAGGNAGLAQLLLQFDEQVERSLIQLKQTDESGLTQFRGVGRAQLPSTVIGLLFHAAEHTMRHVGQLLVTVKILEQGLK